MSLPASLPLSQIQAQDLTALNLQNQERISAEVLQVAGDRVYLAIDGVRVVARLTTSDQAARLMERRRASFIVKDHSPEEILLQLVSAGESGEDTASAPVNLIPELLEHQGVARSESNILLAQELLEHGLPVQKKLMDAINQFLEVNQLLGKEQLSTAVALLARGLPLTPGAFNLLLGNLPPLGQILGQILQQLRKKDLGGKPSLAFYRKQARAAVKQRMITLNQNPEEVLSSLKEALPLLSDSLESEAAARLREGGSAGASTLINLLDQLRRESGGADISSEQLHQLLDRLRLSQYGNTSEKPGRDASQWLHFELPLVFPGLPHPPRNRTAYLKVNTPFQEESGQYDGKHANLNLTIQLGRGEVIAVNLNVYGEKIRALIQANTTTLQEQAALALPGLEARLKEKGYQPQQMNCRLEEELSFPGNPLEIDPHQQKGPSGVNFNKVNVEA